MTSHVRPLLPQPRLSITASTTPRAWFKTALITLTLLVSCSIVAWAQESVTATGVVYHDLNKNGVRDSGEPGIAGVMVSNGDRKSTRLNSSHVAISYAVFCLKKKI